VQAFENIFREEKATYLEPMVENVKSEKFFLNVNTP